MKNTHILLSTVIAASLLTAGCENLSRTATGAMIGTGAGAAVGAAAGAYFGDTTKGAIIGAAVGGVTGAIIGRHMDKQAEELARIENAKVERIGEGIAISFDSGLLFGYDSATLQDAAKANLTQLANTLKSYPESDILIVGHTDDRGSDTYNQSLSVRRAESAKNFLVSQGIAADRIRFEGRGESEPVMANDTDEGRAANRRIELALFASEEYIRSLEAQN